MTVIILSAFSIVGLHYVVDALLYNFNNGRDLDVLWDIIKPHKYSKWLKPVIFCSLCMSSLWGSIFYFVYSFIHGGGVIGWIPSLFAIAGMVYLIEVLAHRH